MKELELMYNKSQSNNLAGPAQSALDDIDKYNIQPSITTTTNNTAKTDNLVIKSEQIKSTNSVDVRQQNNQPKNSYIRAKYAGIKRVRGKNG